MEQHEVEGLAICDIGIFTDTKSICQSLSFSRKRSNQRLNDLDQEDKNLLIIRTRQNNGLKEINPVENGAILLRHTVTNSNGTKEHEG